LPEPTLESLKRYLDAEAQSEKLLPLPSDFYITVATYAQLLKRSANSGSSELANRLIAKQSELLASMVRSLMQARSSKAASQKAVSQLLPEERYICSMEDIYARRLDAFIEAVASGQPSAVDLARKNELGRSTTIRFLKHVDELVGLDLRKYGPFEPEDLALIPAANADLLVASGEAVEVIPRPKP
jgi:DNA replication factor GINS